MNDEAFFSARFSGIVPRVFQVDDANFDCSSGRVALVHDQVRIVLRDLASAPKSFLFVSTNLMGMLMKGTDKYC
jgi:hypothetical protein